MVRVLKNVNVAPDARQVPGNENCSGAAMELTVNARVGYISSLPFSIMSFTLEFRHAERQRHAGQVQIERPRTYRSRSTSRGNARRR